MEILEEGALEKTLNAEKKNPDEKNTKKNMR